MRGSEKYLTRFAGSNMSKGSKSFTFEFIKSHKKLLYSCRQRGGMVIVLEGVLPLSYEIIIAPVKSRNYLVYSEFHSVLI